MNEPEEPPDADSTTSAVFAVIRVHVLPSLKSVFALTLLTGCIFPLAVGIPARLLFPSQANGSLLVRDGSVIGSRLIGQNFTKAKYFHLRPSAAGAGFDAASSGGANLGLDNPKLRNGASDGSFAGVNALAKEYRTKNGLGPNDSVPIDAVTRSGSGLDPHISPVNAALQIRRVASARGLSEDTVRKLVEQHTEGPQLGFLGSVRVSVLTLNVALDDMSSGGTR